jgi:hypothetical protein
VEQAHLKSPVPDPRELVRALPASCASLLQRALAKAPRERHASAQELLWDARRVLQDLTSASPAAAAPRPRPPEAAPAAARSPLPPAAGPMAEVLGFVRQPFSDVDPQDFPRLAEPLAAARARILERLEDGVTSVVALACEDGFGAAALYRALAAELGPSRLVLRVNGEEDRDGRLLLHRLCMAAASQEAPQDLEALVARLDEERAARGTRPLVVIEGISAEPPATAALSGVVGAALWTRSFQVLLGGEPGLLEKLARAGVDFHGERASEIRVAPLDREQLARHLRTWLQETLAPRAPPIIITPDALLLVAMRSGGGLERVNRIVENMLVLAASERRRTLCSWHAWTASDHERWAASPPELPRRPPAWPPPEVVDVIDACRRGAGMPPWPRGASAGTRGGAPSWPTSR